MRLPSKLPTKIVIPLLLASIIGTAAATMTLFTHTFPSVATRPPPSVFTSTCTTLVAVGLIPTQGTAGTIMFGCAAGAPALTATGVAGSVTPTFALPTEYTTLALVQHFPTASSCSVGSPAIVLSTGVAIPVVSGPAVEIDYCAAYTSAPATSFATFTVTWTQA